MPRLRSPLASAALGLVTALGLLAVPAVADSKLSVVAGQPFTFNYSTSSPDSKNWIGIYNTYYGAPDNGRWVARSVSWTWARKSDGIVKAPTSGLEPGLYRAYLLAKDRWDTLAGPIDVVLPSKDKLSFIVDNFTTHNAREGDWFQARVKGLLDNMPDANTKFAKLAADDDEASGWARVADNGTISGTPDADGQARMTVEATASNGVKARLKVTVPVRAAGSPMVDAVGVLSFNTWQGGSHVNDAFRKNVRFLAGAGVDLVGFQESNGGQATRLGQALGWDDSQGPDAGIISRYPIVEAFPEAERGGGVRVALDGDESQVVMWNAHLGFDPYGPYNFCFDKMKVDQVLEQEDKSKRPAQMNEVLARMKDQIANADKVPVILTGDFNAPSHLDWTDATRAQHCNAGNVSWPTSEAPTKAGLVDSFRERHPDPLADPGNTWSPIMLKNDRGPEPMDRIDFVYHKGLTTVDSAALVVGQPKAEPDHKDNEWTSDHAAVKTTFRVDSPAKRARRAFRG